MVGEMYQRGLAQREGRAAGFDPYGQRGWSDTKADYDTNWRRWEVNRWYSGDTGSQAGGRFSSDAPSYSGMLSGTLTGPSVRRGGGTNWSASGGFNGNSATNPAQEIGRLKSAMDTGSNLLSGAGAAFSQAGALNRRIKAAQNTAANLPTLPSPTRMNNGAPSNTVRGVRGNTPAGPRPMMHSPTRGGLVNLNNKQDIDAVANWADEQVSSAPGYGGAFLRNMRNMAQQSQLKNAIRNGGSPQTLPAPGGFSVVPMIGPPKPAGYAPPVAPRWWEPGADKVVDTSPPLSKAGKASLNKKAPSSTTPPLKSPAEPVKEDKESTKPKANRKPKSS